MDCRNTSPDKIADFQTAQAVLTQKLSDAIVSLAYLHDKLDKLKSDTFSPPETKDTELPNGPVPMMATVVETTVLSTLDDLKRRKQNVKISPVRGLTVDF